jgi:hypothetical protein
MHRLLDVHFNEHFCRVEDENTQQVLNLVRKIALNCIKAYKQASNSKLPLSKIMFGCLLDCDRLVRVLGGIDFRGQGHGNQFSKSPKHATIVLWKKSQA